MNAQLSPASVWLQAIRPKTLWAAVAPVLMGTAMAYAEGAGHAGAAAAALTFGVLVQVGTNLWNDYADFGKGADTQDRQGPLRVTQAGLLRPATVRNASVLVFAMALAISGYLAWRGGWPLALLAAFAVLCGFLYTAGPYPLGYVGLGEVFVLVFFGPVAAGGTYYVQALTLTPAVCLAGTAPGLLSVAILVVNNLRDVEQDAQAGKRTLAVRFGKTFARVEYAACLVAAFLLPVVLYARSGRHPWALLVLLLVPLTVPLLRTVFTDSDGRALNPVLARTAQLLLLYAILFSVGWVL